ncbi:MAG TPA: hypothetical protein VHO46_14700 [Bacteroidales bacterium]|nr:hypothetical protein [Bacteroidales bacterium]
MNLKKYIPAILFLAFSINVSSQINRTDQAGLKQGMWVKNYPNGSKMYDGTFRDGHPVGEFKRYYETGVLKSIQVFSDNGRQTDATLYFPSGRIASKGRYIDQKKEGNWQFFPDQNESYLMYEQNFKDDKRDGLSLSFYPDSAIGDRTMYKNDEKNGDREQFYNSGAKYTKSLYSAGKLDGLFEAWYEDGNKMYSGVYKNDIRQGLWIIYNEDGSEKYRINYVNGKPDNSGMDSDASEYINALEKEKGSIPDPEQTGEMW